MFPIYRATFLPLLSAQLLVLQPHLLKFNTVANATASLFSSPLYKIHQQKPCFQISSQESKSLINKDIGFRRVFQGSNAETEKTHDISSASSSQVKIFAQKMRFRRFRMPKFTSHEKIFSLGQKCGSKDSVSM